MVGWHHQDEENRSASKFQLQQKFLRSDDQKCLLSAVSESWKRPQRCSADGGRGDAVANTDSERGQVWAVISTTPQASKAKRGAPCLPAPPSADWPSNTDSRLVHKLDTGCFCNLHLSSLTTSHLQPHYHVHSLMRAFCPDLLRISKNQNYTCVKIESRSAFTLLKKKKILIQWE